MYKGMSLTSVQNMKFIYIDTCPNEIERERMGQETS